MDFHEKVKTVSASSLKKILREFVSSGRPNRMVGSSGHLKSFNWLLDQINKRKGDEGLVHVDDFKPDIDSAVEFYRNDFQNKIANRFAPQSLQYQTWKRAIDDVISNLKKRSKLTGRNIIWEKKGKKKPDELLIIGVHYDTIAQSRDDKTIQENISMPGADDNGSGVSIALKLIELFSTIELKKSVMIVFFDFQELGFLGSKAFVEKYQNYWKKIKLAGFINLLMLGHDSVATDQTKTEGNMKAYIRKQDEAGHKVDLELYKSLSRHTGKEGVRFDLMANSFDSSDVIRFWHAGIPAVVFTQDWENDYNQKNHHTSNDFPETINFKTLYSSFLYLANAILGWNFSS
jgi:Zn-dependent M28 family amino/carboxypeptidase